ncbi:MAG: hypothetical protein DMG05_08190 [Acidobacteria bacterium]|nr:MAG: hypothetical protein DMG05_08190 [Acidobacteriota bacterium]
MVSTTTVRNPYVGSPYYREGFNTTSYEIFQQLGGLVPDWVFVPAGSGGGGDAFCLRCDTSIPVYYSSYSTAARNFGSFRRGSSRFAFRRFSSAYFFSPFDHRARPRL